MMVSTAAESTSSRRGVEAAIMSKPRRAYRQGGYALLIMLVLVAMGVLYLVVNGASIVGLRLGHSTETSTALMRAKEALVGYAATYRDDPTHSSEVFGYLPCPDMTATPTGLQGNGVANSVCGGSGATVAGLLPYKTLGLEDLRDADGVCLWYVVSGNFKNSPEITPMNWDTQGEIQVIDANGNAILAPDDANGGAAAVVIAAGQPLGAQSRTPNANNVCGAMPAEVSAYLESSLNVTGTTILTDGEAKDASGNIVKNDALLPITPKEIFDRIAKRADFRNALTATPPGYVNNLSNKIRIAVETQIQSLLDTPTMPPLIPVGAALPNNQPNYTQFPGKMIGDIEPTLAFASTSDGNWFDDWQNQYRQVTCSDLSVPCLTIAGTQCRGALLFSGRSVTGGPRTSSQAVSGTANLNAFFEAGQGLEILNSASMAFSGQLSYTGPNAGVGRDPTIYTDPYDSIGDRALDTGLCLFPGTFLSFNNGIGSFIAESSLPANAPVAIDTATRTITLGNTAASGTNSGCAWSPAIPFNTSLRAYFTFRIADRGEGFVFALADAARNSPTSTLCGNGGGDLGYSGAGIQYPKLGLEIDTRPTTGKRDPARDHVAFIYWGTAALASDDNAHGTPSPPTIDGTQPLNPRGLGSSSILGIFWVGNVATVTTSGRHYLIPNQNATITGVNPAGFNGNYRVTPIDDTRFSYTLATNPGLYMSGGAVTSPFFGISTVKASDTLLPPDPATGSTLPSNTDIHVRVDILRNHGDTSATYHMAAYVVSVPEPEAPSSCVTVSNLKNLSFDMENLNCSRGPTVSQDNIVINDISGFAPALSSVYAGFTNGQRDNGTNPNAGEQNITISNFVLRIQ